MVQLFETRMLAESRKGPPTFDDVRVSLRDLHTQNLVNTSEGGGRGRGACDGEDQQEEVDTRKLSWASDIEFIVFKDGP